MTIDVTGTPYVRLAGCNTQLFVHARCCRGVLHKHFLVWLEHLLYDVRGQRRFVKPTQDQLLFAFVGVDITNCVNTGHAGFVGVLAIGECFSF